MSRKLWIISIIFLFLASAVTPMAVGFDSRISEEDEYLENLAFACSDRYSSSKLTYYEKSFQRDYSNNDVVESKEITLPVDLPSAAMVGGPMDSPWPMKSHDVRHTGRSLYSTADNPGIEKWRFYTDGIVEGGPVIGDDGTIYFGTMGSDRRLYALYPDGTFKWDYKTNGLIWSSPAIDEDGTIYVGSWDHHLHAVNPNGTRKWCFNGGDAMSSAPAIAEDGTIYFGVMGPGNKGRVWAVYTNGTEKWHYDTGYWIVSDPAIGDDGTVYIGSGDTYLYALWPNGTLRWRFPTGDEIHGDPSIAEDGTVYIASYDKCLYALYPNNGSMKWKIGVGISVQGGIAIAEDGTIYIGTDKLRAIYPNGTLRWSFDIGSFTWIYKSTPAISADGTIYVGTHIGSSAGGDIIAINSDGTERWRKNIAYNSVESSPSIAEDGTVYIGSSSHCGYLHAFGSIESNSPPGAPVINGPTRIRVGKEYWYTFGAVDPDKNPVRFYIDWGDGTSTGWTGEFASGERYYFEHTWSEQGIYNISAKAKDVMDEESDWGYLEVTVPKNKAFNFNFNFLEQLFERFTNAFPIFRYLLGL